MRIKMKAEGTDKILASLKDKSLKGKVVVTGSVVYDAPHAVYVHEDLEKYHEPPTQAKYLEQPAREMSRDLAATVRRSVKAKNGLEEGVERALNQLLERSQELVPVETGELKESGHVEMEGRKAVTKGSTKGGGNNA